MAAAGHDLIVLVDDFYFSALHDHEEQFPISDEGYAEELQLQEVLINSSRLISSTNPPIPSVFRNRYSSLPSRRIIKAESDYKLKGACSSSRSGKSSSLISQSRIGFFCSICMENKKKWDIFFLDGCTHSFCVDCVSKYVATKIQEGAMMEIVCPDANCRESMDPGSWKTLVPKEVFQRWENAQFELMILGSKKFYCPFKDCSALMEDDMGNVIGSAECPACHRLFCVQCKVPWHQGLDCGEYQRVGNDENSKNDLLAMKLVKDKQWMKCPRCSYYVERIDGCLHIVCRCMYEFCYRCGSSWSKTHECVE